LNTAPVARLQNYTSASAEHCLPKQKQIKQGERETMRISAVMRDVPRIDSSADAFDTLARLNQIGTTLALIEQNGVVTGVLTEADYTHAFTIQKGFQSRFTV
jgi:predicted transcriptional regulator